MTDFRWDGGAITVSKAFWNPFPKYAPGLQITMWGCGARTGDYWRDGAMRNDSPTVFRDTAAKTGIALDPVSREQQWTPCGASPLLPEYLANWHGFSTLHVNTQGRENGGGLGMYATSGPKPAGGGVGGSFFQVYGPNGQGNGGAGYGMGLFPTFATDHQKEEARVRPWLNFATMVMETEQTVNVVKVDSPTPNDVAQAKQQVVFTVGNLASFEQKAAVRQFQVVYHTAVYRRGPGYTRQAASIWYDPEQGGLPIVDILTTGNGDYAVVDGVAVARDMLAGAERSAPFTAPRLFSLEISYAHLMGIVRIVAGRRCGKRWDRLLPEDIAATWGSAAEDPNQWVLMWVSPSQELHSKNIGYTVEIGGGVRSIGVRAKE